MYYNGKKVMATVLTRIPSFVYVACMEVYAVTDDEIQWNDVRVLFASNTEYAITDMAGLAKALHEAGYTSETSFAHVVYSKSSGYLPTELSGAYSSDGERVSFVLTSGRTEECTTTSVELKKYTRI